MQHKTSFIIKCFLKNILKENSRKGKRQDTKHVSAEYYHLYESDS